MTIMVKDLPNDERPREKLIKYGAKYLSNTELLAILLRTGTKKESVIRLAERLLARYRDVGISAMLHQNVKELSNINGVGEVKAATVLAAIELGRRLTVAASSKGSTIRTPEDVADFVMPRLRHAEEEHFAVLLLDAKNQIISYQDVSVGILNQSLAHPREIFRAAIRYGAGAIILTHNHPSGDPRPSEEDIKVTKRLTESGDIIGIPVLDHVIIGDGTFFSLKENDNF